MLLRSLHRALFAAVFLMAAAAAHAEDLSRLPQGVERQQPSGEPAAEEGAAAAPAEGGAEAQPAEGDAEPAEAETAPAATAAADSAAQELSIYQELKTVENQVGGLKEKVFRSKARLLLLEEKVIRGVVSGAKAVIRHVNELGAAYALDSVTYYFDGNPIYQKTDVGTGGQLSKEKKVQLFEANIPPGNHTISVAGVIKGKGSGLFAYLSDYTFQFSSAYSFVAEDGKTTRVDSVLLKKGGPLADYVEGPTVEFRVVGGDKGKGGKGADEEAGAEASGTGEAAPAGGQ
jgi:hypothetical protein